MPGVTPLGLRYPYQNETVTAQSWQDLATDIDTALTTLNTFRSAAMRRPTASISNDGSLAVTTATGVDGLMLFNVVNWDTAGLANLGVNNDRLTLTSGIWWARISHTALSGFTTYTASRIQMLTTPGPQLFPAQGLDTVGIASPGPIIASGPVVVTDPAVGLQMRIRWTGTGGPAAWNRATMQVYKIRDLANL